MTTETKRSDEDLEIDRAPIDQLRDVKAIESSQVDLSVQDDTNSNMPTEHTQQLPERRPRLMSQLDLEDPTFRYQDAAIYLQEGQNNDRFDTHPTQQTINWYLIAHSTLFYVLDLMAAILLLALGLTEKPASGVVPIDDKLFLPVPVHATLELLSLLVVTSGLAVKLKWQGPKHFFTHKRTLLKVIILIVVAVEAITVLVRRTNHVRVTRALRPLFLIDTHYCYGVRRVLRQIFLSLPPILDMLFLLLFIMLIFAMLGFYLFSDNEKDEYFSSFWRSFVSLFVLLTTANYPDVMMPAYSRSRWSIIYFGAYISVVLYFLMNLLLAVVYDTFTSIEKNKFRKLFLHKRHGVRHAYKLICSQNPPHWISLSHFVGLMTFYKPSSSLLEKFLVFKSLDINQRRQLSLDEFYQVYENSEMTWKKDADRDVHWLRCCRSCGCLHSIFKGIRWLVTRKQFEFVIYVIIILNGISFIVDTIVFSNTPQQERAAKRHEVKWYHIAFITIYAAEAFLKIIGLGLRRYFLSGWNAFDFIVTLLGFIGAVGPTSFSFVVCLRPVRLLLLFKLKQRYRDVLNTMVVLLPRMTRVALVIVLLYYSFGIIGIECFSGLPLRDCCKNTSVEANYKDDGYYYLNNFDDLLYSYVTLFELTVVNNWFIIMEGVVYVTSDWARIYFMLFYIVTMVVMTIIVAFVLEAFLFRIQYRKEHPTDEKEDMKIRKEITVTYEELLGLDEELVTHLQPGQPVKYVGKRPKTKMDLSVKMYKDEVKEWIQKERIIDMGETLDQIDILEDSPHVLSLNMTQNGHTSPVPAHMSRDGHVRQEPDVGAINAGADVEYTL